MPGDSIRRLAPPLGILYIASVLKKDHQVKILDSTLEGYYNTKVEDGYITYGLDEKDIKHIIKAFHPDYVGISSMFSAHQKNALNHAKWAKETDSSITTILGGIHPSLFPEETIKDRNVDFVIIGEGEFRTKKLLDGNLDFDGLAYKKRGNITKINPMTTRIDNLDTIPFPSRELIDFEKYIKIGVPYAPFPLKERTAQVQTSRGCPYNCVFCSTVQYWGRQFRVRSVDNIMTEIDELVNKYGIEEIQFTDDNMTINKNRAKELFKRLKDYDLSWCPPHGLMANALDPEMISLMADSGAYQLTIAIESGSPRVRKDIIGKTVPSKEKMKLLINTSHKHNIQVHGLFIIGLPGETREEINMTFKYPYEVGFDSISLFIANPMPGSELYQICKRKGYLVPNLKSNVKTAEMNIPTNSPDYVMPNEELTRLVEEKTREYNEFIKTQYPGRWEKKFKQFLKKHDDKADLLLGRVT